MDLVRDLVSAESMQVNVHEAKTSSRGCANASSWVEVVIAKGGQAGGEARPDRAARERAAPGSASGDVWVGPDFDAPLPDELLAGFE